MRRRVWSPVCVSEHGTEREAGRRRSMAGDVNTAAPGSTWTLSWLPQLQTAAQLCLQPKE